MTEENSWWTNISVPYIQNIYEMDYSEKPKGAGKVSTHKKSVKVSRSLRARPSHEMYPNVFK